MTEEFEDRDVGPTEPQIEGGQAQPPAGPPPEERQEGEEFRQDDRGGRDRGRRDRRPRVDSFEKMKVWQEAHALTMRVFQITPNLPGEQQAGLAQQMEESAVAVPKNIAEGFKRRGPRNKAHFYNLAQTALESLRYYFILCRDLKLDIPYEDLAMQTEQISRMLDGLIRSMLRS